MVNFSIIVGVAVICRPTSNSNLLSYASQLPMEDPGEALFVRMRTCIFNNTHLSHYFFMQMMILTRRMV